MKRNVLSAVAILLVLLMMTTILTACGGSSSSAESNPEYTTLTDKDGIIAGALEDGTYEMTKLYIGGAENARLLEMLEKGEMNTDLVVNGTKIVLMEIEYTLEDGKFVNSDDTVQYAVKGDVITVLDEDESKMIFKKK